MRFSTHFRPLTSHPFHPLRHLRLQVESLEGRALLSAGDLDLTFGGTGFLTKDLGANSNQPRAIAVQSWDNKIVAATSGSGNLNFTLARFNQDGSLDDGTAGDTTPGDKFGANGVVNTDFYGGQDRISQILLTSDHKILAVGYAYSNSGQNVALARYNNNGALDTTFGSGGKVVTQLTGNAQGAGKTVILDPSGRIIVGGSAGSGGNANLLLRYNTSGSLDTTFGSKGKVIGNYGSYTYDFWGTLRLQAAGSSYKIIAEGSDQGSHALVQFNANGSRDSTFGSNGEVLLGLLPGGGTTVPVVFQPDGKVVGAYADGTTDHNAVVVVRYNPDGSLDNGFGPGGRVVTTANSLFGGSPAVTMVQALAIDSTGRILVAGGAGLYGSDGLDSLLLRYTPTGALDSSFGSNGEVITNISHVYSNEMFTTLALQPDGKIVAAGYAPVSYDPNSGSSTLNLSLARFWADSPPAAPLISRAALPATTMTSTDPTLIPLVLDDPVFLNSLVKDKRRHG